MMTHVTLSVLKEVIYYSKLKKNSAALQQRLEMSELSPMRAQTKRSSNEVPESTINHEKIQLS